MAAVHSPNPSSHRLHTHACPAATALPPTPSSGTMLPLGHPLTDPASAGSFGSSDGGGPRTPLDSEYGRAAGQEKRWNAAASGMVIPPFVRRERGGELRERRGSAMEVEGESAESSGMAVPREERTVRRSAEGLGDHSKRGAELLDREDDDDRMEEDGPVIKRESSSSTSAANSTDSSPRLAKRTRRLSPFDSLATAASSILSSLPYPPVSPIVLGFQGPTDPTQAEQVKAAMEMRAQQMREIERRRAATATNGGSGGGGGLSGLQNALGKLKADREEAEGSGLAKRRANVKTKNLTILTPSYGMAGTQGGLKSAPIKAKAGVEGAPAIGKSGLATAYPRFEGSTNGTPATSAPHSHKAPPTTSSRRGSLVGPPSVRQQVPCPASTSSRHPPHPTPTYAAAATHPHPPHHPAAYPHSAHPSHPQFPTSHPLHQPPRSYASPPTTLQSPAHPPHTHHPRAPPPPPPPASPHPSAAPVDRSKAAFLSLFSDFYDSLSDSRVLTYTLEEQIRKSSTLLHSLQESGKIFEEMLDTRVQGVVHDMSRDLQLCENRIVRLERAVGGRVDRPMSETGLGGPERGMSERLEKLERLLEVQEEARAGHAVSNVRGGGGGEER